MTPFTPSFNPDGFSLGELTTYQVGALQASANRALKKHGDALLKQYGISSMQWHIIGAILDQEPTGARISQLAKHLDTTMGFLTNQVNLLESKGMLVRSDDESDLRSRYVRVNPNFMPTCTEIELLLRKKLRESIYCHISPEELHTYIKVITKLGNIKEV